MKRHAALALLFPLLWLFLGLGACTTIGHEKVEGWPQLTVVEHYVPHHVMRDRCVKYASWGTAPEACAEFNLVEQRCDVWFSADFPPLQAFLDLLYARNPLVYEDFRRHHVRFWEDDHELFGADAVVIPDGEDAAIRAPSGRTRTFG